ncbi:alpha/beta fold hydrolase [Pseudooceanicola sp. C21-150M6]|uniref:alpha/beta fold hydrolase n=1 Tax=Pseudooceanicola sp. C21-150M6 TaxID=3434355 RepID=UPI003D7FA692
MAHIILVHGACHGAWCWSAVTPLLEAAGHEVTALDMPGRGAGVEGLTLGDQARTILDAYEGKAVLVGHSAGGISISAACEAAPEKVAHLVYVAALLPRDGDSLGEMMRDLEGPRASLPLLKVPHGYIFDVTTEGAGAALYNDAPEAAMQAALAQVCAEPSAPHREKVRLGATFDAAPKSYVLCTQDHVIPEVDQRRMVAGLDPVDVPELVTGHSPFISMPEELARIIDQIAKAA